jgi:SPP1 family predicted phage head-tail adaptor
VSAALPAIGTLTDRVQLMRRDTAPEAEGGQAVTYVPIASLWARVRTLSMREARQGDGRGVGLSHSVVVRFRTDVRPGDRFVYRGRMLEVRGTEDLNGRRSWLGCQCAETAFTG